jgi:hypothetical protein
VGLVDCSNPSGQVAAAALANITLGDDELGQSLGARGGIVETLERLLASESADVVEKGAALFEVGTCCRE